MGGYLSQAAELAADPAPQPGWRRMALLIRLPDPTVSARYERLRQRAGRYLLLVPLVFRLLVLPAPLIAMVAEYGGPRLAPVLVVATALGALNLVELGVVVARPELTERAVRAALVADLAAALAANLLAAGTVPGSPDAADHEVFWTYVFWTYYVGTVVLWASAWGIRAGLVPVAAGLPTQAVMSWLNRADFDADTAERWWVLVLALCLTVLVLGLIAMGMRLALVIGIRSGRAAERARMMRGLHDTVLQTLEAMALSSGLDHAEPAAALAELRGMARGQATRLRRALGELTEHSGQPLVDALAELVAESAADGLAAELVAARLDEDEIPEPRRLALRDAVAEALRNTRKHAGPCTAVVRLDEQDGAVRVVVRDHGTGFAVDEVGFGFGLAESVYARLSEVGGRARVESWPGRGTRVSLWVPR